MAGLIDNLQMQTLWFMVKYFFYETPFDGDFLEGPFPHLYDAMRLLLERCPQLQHLYVYSSSFEDVSDDELSRTLLRHYPRLATFSYDTDIQPLLGWYEPARFKDVCILTQCRLINGFLPILQHLCFNMQDLRLDSSAVKGTKWEIVKSLGGFPHLRRLHLKGNHRIGDIPNATIVCLLETSPSIETLIWDMVHLFDDAVFDTLGSMKSLICLELSCCHKINIPGLQRFASTTISLRSVHFRQFSIICDGLCIHQSIEQVMIALSEIRQLRQLRLSNYGAGAISENFVDNLKSASLLTVHMLDIRDAHEAVLKLARIPSIDYITVDYRSKLDKEKTMAILKERTTPLLIVKDHRRLTEQEMKLLPTVININFKFTDIFT